MMCTLAPYLLLHTIEYGPSSWNWDNCLKNIFIKLLTVGFEGFCRYFQHSEGSSSRRLLKTYWVQIFTSMSELEGTDDGGGRTQEGGTGAALLAGTLILSSPSKVTSTGTHKAAPSWEIQYSNIPNKQTNNICVCDKSVVKDVSFGTRRSTPASHQQQASSLYWS